MSTRNRLTLPATYSSSGEKRVLCRGRKEVVAGQMTVCFFPVALSDGKSFYVTGKGHMRTGKATCPVCGYVTTLRPKML